MNILEKILKQTEDRRMSYKQELEIEVGGRRISELKAHISELNWIIKTIRSYMDEVVVVKSESSSWIPVSERLPEERDSLFARFKGTEKWNNCMFEKRSAHVNVTIELQDGTIKTRTSYTLDGKWAIEKDNRDTGLKVIAWQPLPEAYK